MFVIKGLSDSCDVVSRLLKLW